MGMLDYYKVEEYLVDRLDYTDNLLRDAAEKSRKDVLFGRYDTLNTLLLTVRQGQFDAEAVTDSTVENPEQTPVELAYDLAKRNDSRFRILVDGMTLAEFRNVYKATDAELAQLNAAVQSMFALQRRMHDVLVGIDDDA